MQTRSSSKFVGEPSTNPTSTILKRRNRRRSIQRVEPFSLVETPVVTMADQRTMTELLCAPVEGYAEAIVVPPIPAEHFELKHSLINLVTSKQLFGFEKEDPHAHIRYFNKITSTLKYKDVPETSIKLMLFLFSIDEIASAVTSAMTAMFKQHQVTPAPASVKAVEESCVTCGGAHSYRQYPTTDGNTFSGYQDNIQGYVSAAAVNYNQGNTGYRPQNVANQIRPPGFGQPNVQNNQTRYNQGYNQNRRINQGNQNYQALAYQAPIHQPQVVTTSDFSKYIKANDATMFGQIMKMNTASTSGSGSLPSNTIANPRGDLKEITTRSDISYDGPPIPPPSPSLPKVVEREPEVTKDTVQPSNENIQPLVVQIQALIDEPVVAPKPKLSIPYPLRANKQKLHEKDDNLASKFVEIFRELHFELSFADALLHMTARVLIDVYGEELTLRVDDEAITFKVSQTSIYSYNDAVSINRIDVINVACEEYAQEVLGFSDSSTSGNPTPSLDPILSTSSPSLTPFEEGDFILEEIEACLTNDSIPPGIDDDDFDPEGDLLLLEKLLNDDPSLLSLIRTSCCGNLNRKIFIDDLRS
ncbi:hypothetical protein Tco_0010999 [Tanacetum coccineum]